MYSIEYIIFLLCSTNITDRYGPYLSTVEVATIRKLFAARTTPAENSAWLSVVATRLSWTGITVHAAVIPTSLLVLNWEMKA